MADPGSIRAAYGNWNVKVISAYRWSRYAFTGLYQLGVGSTLIYLIEDRSNTKVGILQCVQGTAIVLAALPAGWLADRYRRDYVMKLSGTVFLLAIVLLGASLLLPKQPLTLGPLHTDTFLVLFGIGLATSGVANGAAGSAVESLLGDSVATGSRAKLYSFMFSMALACTALGPAIAGLVFVLTGNQWTVSSLRLVMLIGLVFCLVPALLSFCMDDGAALGAESEGILAAQLAGPSPDEETGEKAKQMLQKKSKAGVPVAAVPYLLCASDILGVAAGGIISKFQALWLFEDVGLSPLALMAVQTVMPLCIAFATPPAQKLAAQTGRVQAMILIRSLAALVGLPIGLFPSLWRSKAVCLPLYFAVAALVNPAQPLGKSVLADYVPKAQRGRWNSVESINQFGWSGTALIGGLLIDRIGFASVQVISCIAMLVAVLPLFPLLAVVPRKEAGVAAILQELSPTARAALLGDTGSQGSADGDDEKGPLLRSSE